jgi:hypothetical protein
MMALLMPKFQEARFAQICKLSYHLLMRSKGKPRLPVQLARNVVNPRNRQRGKRRSALARKDHSGFPEAANCTLSPVEPRADLDKSASVHVMVENLDLVTLAK